MSDLFYFGDLVFRLSLEVPDPDPDTLPRTGSSLCRLKNYHPYKM